MLSTREAYGQALVRFAEKYDYLVLDADLSKATQTIHFAQSHPHRFFNMGIAEGNMMSVAAGMAASGKTVFASTFAVFAAGRAFEQVRNSIAYPHLNVKIAATHGGVLIGEDGGSHQAIEDIATMRALPGMVVLAPCDEYSVFRAVEAAIAWDGPVYLRFGRFPAPPVYQKPNPAFQIGKGNVLRRGDNVTLMAHGDMVSRCLQAAELLVARGISACVVDMHTIKPLDTALVLKKARETRHIVTAEDHNIIGGLGSAVAEVLAESSLPCVLRRVGVPDHFGQSGTPEALAQHFGLTAENIALQAQQAIESSSDRPVAHSHTTARRPV